MVLLLFSLNVYLLIWFFLRKSPNETIYVFQGFLSTFFIFLEVPCKFDGCVNYNLTVEGLEPLEFCYRSKSILEIH